MRLKYVLSEAFVGLWRNVTMTIAMIITMTVSLTLLGASVLLFKEVNHMKDFYYQQVNVSIFLKVDATNDQQSALQTALSTDPLIKTVSFESKEEAFQRFQEMWKDAPDLIAATKADSLPSSFKLKLFNTDDFDKVKASYGTKPGVDVIVDPRQLLAKVFDVLGSLQKLALIIAIVQAAAALLLVINTIQVAAYSKRREVSVMKLVGASNWFIQAPFVLEAIAAGVFGAILAYIALVAAKYYIFDGALRSLQSILTPMPWSWVHWMLPILAAAGAAVTSITGWVALRFYLKP
jgi:cell division transport system permease protein